jgi:hypothetical protein
LPQDLGSYKFIERLEIQLAIPEGRRGNLSKLTLIGMLVFRVNINKKIRFYWELSEHSLLNIQLRSTKCSHPLYQKCIKRKNVGDISWIKIKMPVRLKGQTGKQTHFEEN